MSQDTSGSLRLPVTENSDGDFVCSVCRQVLAYEGDDEFKHELIVIINKNQANHLDLCPVKHLRR